ncbi:MAG: LacI family DNA-binding transcriptional regulator [Spirochaetaceae bacterium]|nr:LacI family DNA-binding transcriptional regulator [Spirochaetaceae bacterium]
MKVTVNRIAEIAKVSRGTVDRVIHDRSGVNEGVRKRVHEIIEALDYTPNLAGKALVSQNKNIEIAVVLAPDFHPFVDELRAGIKTAAEEIKTFGVKVDIEVVKTLDVKEQLEILNRLERRNIAGLAIVPINDDLVRQRLNTLTGKGIPVITFNSDIKGTGRLAFVGQNNEKAGRTAYGLMENILPAGSTIAVITSSMGLDCHRYRLRGFQKRLEDSESKLEIVSIDENRDRDEKAFDIIMDYSEKYPDIKGIYLTGGGAIGLKKGLKICGMEKNVKVITHDRVPPVIELMESGIAKFTICQNPRSQGALPINLLFDYIFKKKSPDNELNFTGIDIRTIDNI